MSSKKNDKEQSPEPTAHVHGPHCNHGHHHDKQEPDVNQGPKIGRNDPCPCGSSKKYKKCCGQ